LVEGLRQEIVHVRQEMKDMQTSKMGLDRKVQRQETEIHRLSVAVRAYRARVEYLTDRIVDAQIVIADWNPPDVRNTDAELQ
jgi:septal ring factor EnvC (AmiA/AmiB activator)